VVIDAIVRLADGRGDVPSFRSASCCHARRVGGTTGVVDDVHGRGGDPLLHKQVTASRACFRLGNDATTLNGVGQAAFWLGGITAPSRMGWVTSLLPNREGMSRGHR
jgi:hypothetical protein